jgi:hypothetical protein
MRVVCRSAICGHVLGPALPIAAVAALEDDAGVDGVLPFLKLREVKAALHLADLGFAVAIALIAGLAATHADDLNHI